MTRRSRMDYFRFVASFFLGVMAASVLYTFLFYLWRN